MLGAGAGAATVVVVVVVDRARAFAANAGVVSRQVKIAAEAASRNRMKRNS
jgi:hypothetical protein